MSRCLILLLFFLKIAPVVAIPMYDEGSMMVNGVQLLQDKEDKNGYYYIPQAPRLSVKSDNTFELLCLKYVGKNKENNGGLFHALVEFNLPIDLLSQIEIELKKKNPKGRILGPVPMMEYSPKESETAEASFRIISATLSSTEMKKTLVTSGKAPITPGSKAAIAALLSEQGATLLWNSLKLNTSDVSVALDAYYEAAVKGYNATVTADVSVLYQHFSSFSSQQNGYQKQQIRKVVDSLAKTNKIKVEVFDRSQGLHIKTGDMEAILNLVTNKLIDVMFNLEKGWAVAPNPVKQDVRNVGKKEDGKHKLLAQIGDYICMGPFAGLLGTKFNDEYIPDDQYILKEVKDIRTTTFLLNLSKSSTIKVPIHTAGNIGGLFSLLGNDERYFSIVNMDDAMGQRKEVQFLLNNKYADGFDEWINAVSVNVRKKYGNHQTDFTKNIVFSADDLKKGAYIKTIDFPRLGLSTEDWDLYEYQIKWDYRNLRNAVSDTGWIQTRNSIVSLNFPFDKEEILIEVDTSAFKTPKISAVEVIFAAQLAGEKQKVRSVLFRKAEVERVKKVFIYRDPKQSIVYQVKWHTIEGAHPAPLKILKETNYILLIPQ